MRWISTVKQHITYFILHKHGIYRENVTLRRSATNFIFHSVSFYCVATNHVVDLKSFRLSMLAAQSEYFLLFSIGCLNGTICRDSLMILYKIFPTYFFKSRISCFLYSTSFDVLLYRRDYC